MQVVTGLGVGPGRVEVVVGLGPIGALLGLGELNSDSRRVTYYSQ